MKLYCKTVFSKLSVVGYWPLVLVIESTENVMKFSTVCLIAMEGNSFLVKVQISMLTEVSGFKYCYIKIFII